MTRFILAAGVAALAITAQAGAKPGGGGHGDGNKGQSAQSARVAHGGGGSGKAAGVERRGGGKAVARADRRGGGQRFAAMDRGKGHNAKTDRRQGRLALHNRIDNRRSAKADHFNKTDRFNRHDQRIANRFGQRNRPERFARSRVLVGQVIPVAYSRGVVPLGLRDLYRDNDDYYYRYGDGYMYRVDRRTNLIASLLPLLGGGYMAGQPFPTTYMNSYVPNYYQSFYPDTADNYYRYANGNVYGIDPYSGMIENVIPMYGYGYGYGQMLPSSYSYYNVPYQYRSMYYDTPDYNYRYAPGAIYQVDPRSNLITAVASLLAGDLGVGSRLPLGYSAYNVPLAYRSSYYDTPNAWYRYNDGYIYRVDPKTRLVTAVINGLV